MPFPSAEVYVALPWHDRLMEALARTIWSACRPATICATSTTISTARASATRSPTACVHAFGRTLRAQDFPISIDTADFARMATSAEAVRASQRLSRSLLGRKLIIGVDRLDYTKGITERLRAYEALLQNYPRQRGQVTFVQISAPSREEVPEYLEMRAPGRGGLGAHQRPLRRVRLDAAALPQPRLHAPHARRASSACRGSAW